MTGALSSLPSKYILFVSVYLTFKTSHSLSPHQPTPKQKPTLYFKILFSTLLSSLALTGWFSWDVYRVHLPPWFSLNYCEALGPL